MKHVLYKTSCKRWLCRILLTLTLVFSNSISSLGQMGSVDAMLAETMLQAMAAKSKEQAGNGSTGISMDVTPQSVTVTCPMSSVPKDIEGNEDYVASYMKLMFLSDDGSRWMLSMIAATGRDFCLKLVDKKTRKKKELRMSAAELLILLGQ